MYFAWPSMTRSHVPSATHHTRAVPSKPQLTSLAPSGVNAPHVLRPSWPWSN